MGRQKTRDRRWHRADHGERAGGADFGRLHRSYGTFSKTSRTPDEILITWALVRSKVVFTDREPFPFRTTVVFVLEDGTWRIAQLHNLVASSNFENVGVSLTTTLEELIEALDGESASRLREAARLID